MIGKPSRPAAAQLQRRRSARVRFHGFDKIPIPGPVLALDFLDLGAEYPYPEGARGRGDRGHGEERRPES
jgi:hypothetical protein